MRGSDRVVNALNGVSLTVGPGETLGIVGESGCGKSTLAKVLVRPEEPTSGRVMLDGIDLTALSGRRLRERRRRIQMVFQVPHSALNPRRTTGRALDEVLLVRAEIMNLLVRLRGELGLSYLFISHDVAMVRHLSDRIAVMYLGRIVEVGSWSDVLDRPRHPYTRALREAVPVPDPRVTGPIEATVTGEVPDPAKPPSGCPFHPRCPIAEDACRTVEPELLDLAPGHAVACHVAARFAAESGPAT